MVKGAIASVEIFGSREDEETRRFTLTITEPARAEALEGEDSEGRTSPEAHEWECRVALANLHRPTTVRGRDSVAVLAHALELARDWIAEMRAQGYSLYRDRAGQRLFELV